MTSEAQNTPISQWRSVKALAERINRGSTAVTMSEHSIRHAVRNADDNGLAAANAVRRLGRKLLINEQRFLSWLEDKQ